MSTAPKAEDGSVEIYKKFTNDAVRSAAHLDGLEVEPIDVLIAVIHKLSSPHGRTFDHLIVFEAELSPRPRGSAFETVIPTRPTQTRKYSKQQ